MTFERVNFLPLQLGGDDVTAALRKIDINFGDLDTTLAGYPDVVQKLGNLGQIVDQLGDASRKNVGTASGTVAAGDDDRLAFGGFRNKLINPSFDIWQRGAGGFKTGYTADRWLTTSQGNTNTVDRIAIDPGTASSRYAMRHTVVSTAGDGNFSAMQHRVEGVNTLAGKRVTVSFLASSSVAGKKVGVNLEQNFGGGSASTSLPGKVVALSGSFQRYTFQFQVPALAGKVIGSSGNDFLELIIWLDAGSSFDARSGGVGQQSAVIYVTDVELKEGWIDTPFERRPLAVEVPMCQRYFEKSYGLEIAPGTAHAGGFLNEWTPGLSATVSFSRPFLFRAMKRAAPAIQIYASATGAVGKVTDGGTQADVGASVYTASDSAFTWTASMQTSLQVNYGAHFTADAEL